MRADRYQFRGWYGPGSEVNLAFFAQLAVLLGFHALVLLLHLVEVFDIFVSRDAVFGAEVLADEENAAGLDKFLFATHSPANFLLTSYDVVSLVPLQTQSLAELLWA